MEVDRSLALGCAPLSPGGDGRLAGGRVVGAVVEGLAGEAAQDLVGLFTDDVYAGGASPAPRPTAGRYCGPPNGPIIPTPFGA